MLARVALLVDYVLINRLFFKKLAVHFLCDGIDLISLIGVVIEKDLTCCGSSTLHVGKMGENVEDNVLVTVDG